MSISLSSVITREAVAGTLEPDMSHEEQQPFEGSVETIRRASERIGVGTARAYPTMAW